MKCIRDFFNRRIEIKKLSSELDEALRQEAAARDAFMKTVAAAMRHEEATRREYFKTLRDLRP